MYPVEIDVGIQIIDKNMEHRIYFFKPSSYTMEELNENTTGSST